MELLIPEGGVKQFKEGHLLKEGHRLTLELKMVAYHTEINGFGTSYFISFVDRDKNLYSWRSNTKPDPSLLITDKYIPIKATIKHGTNIQGEPRTYIQRLRLDLEFNKDKSPS